LYHPARWSGIAYSVLGAKPKSAFSPPGEIDIEASCELRSEGGAAVIQWSAQNYDSASISRELLLKRNETIKDDKGEKNAQRDLEPGKYALVVKVKDRVSGATVEKNLPIEVR
jgi:hypothetical protein